jgi:hypothetical protein
MGFECAERLRPSPVAACVAGACLSCATPAWHNLHIFRHSVQLPQDAHALTGTVDAPPSPGWRAHIAMPIAVLLTPRPLCSALCCGSSGARQCTALAWCGTRGRVPTVHSCAPKPPHRARKFAHEHRAPCVAHTQRISSIYSNPSSHDHPVPVDCLSHRGFRSTGSQCPRVEHTVRQRAPLRPLSAEVSDPSAARAKMGRRECTAAWLLLWVGNDRVRRVWVCVVPQAADRRSCPPAHRSSTLLPPE